MTSLPNIKNIIQSKPKGSIAVIGVLTLFFTGISIYNLIKIYEFKGCLSCSCDGENNANGQKKIDAILAMNTISILVCSILLVVCFMVANNPNLFNMLDSMALAYAILSFILLLFDSVSFGILQYDKNLTNVRDMKAYKNYKITIGILIGFRAFIFVSLIGLYVYYKKREQSSTNKPVIPTDQSAATNITQTTNPLIST